MDEPDFKFDVSSLPADRQILYKAYSNMIKKEKAAANLVSISRRVPCEITQSFNDPDLYQINVKNIMQLKLYEGCSIVLTKNMDDKNLVYFVSKKICIEDCAAIIEACPTTPILMRNFCDQYCYVEVRVGVGQYAKMQQCLKQFFTNNTYKNGEMRLRFPAEIQRFALCEENKCDDQVMYVDQDFILKNPSNHKLSAVVGPPGSGKTHLIEQIAVKNVKNCLNEQILVLCVQNSACDSLLKKMKNSFPGKYDIMRLNSQQHQKFIMTTEMEQFCIKKLLTDSLEGKTELIEQNIQSKYYNLTQELQSFNADLYELLAKRKKSDADTMDIRELKTKIKHAKNTLKSIENMCFTKIVKDNVKVIVTTACMVFQIPSDYNFPIVLFDEAGYASPLHIFMAAVLVNHERGKMILFGDIKQLEPFYMDSSNAAKVKFNDIHGNEVLAATTFSRSLLYRFTDEFNYQNVQKLNLQKRTVSPISDIISKLFYNNELLTCPSLSKQTRLSLLGGKHVMFITHECSEEDLGIEEFSYTKRSKINRGEADIIKNLYQRLPSLLNSSNINGKIAILTFYSAQKFHLKSLQMNCDINTVDGYQGQEKDIVIISCVRQNKEGTIGFLQSPFRLCTALSRTRDILIIVCGRMFENHACKMWKELLDYRHAAFAVHEQEI